MKPTLTKIWMEDRRNGASGGYGDISILVDFDNDRRYEAIIKDPYDSDSVAHALHSLATLIKSDPRLRPNVVPTKGETL